MTYRTDDASATDDSLSQLSTALAGEVIGPTDPEYDRARVCFNALVDRRPAAIARCLGPTDIATAFDFARTHELEVAVRGGGHNPAGHCIIDGGLVIDLSLLRSSGGRPARTDCASAGWIHLARLRFGHASGWPRHPRRCRRLHGRVWADARRRDRSS